MPDSMAVRLAKLQQMTAAQLRQEWLQLLASEPRSGNRAWMLKRLAWALQAKVHGGLSASAQARLDELLPLAETWMPRGKKIDVALKPAPVRRPGILPGTILTRVYKGQTLTVLVREDGRLEFEGAFYDSLTAIAKAVTGSHWNGTHFFRMQPRRGRA